MLLYILDDNISILCGTVELVMLLLLTIDGHFKSFSTMIFEDFILNSKYNTILYLNVD